jgi:tetratricopeptide (TPR) repeat protein
MRRDIRGLPVAAASDAAMAAYDHAIAGYASYRADIPARMEAVFAQDPEFALAHCLKGYFAMLAFKQAAVPMAVQALADARRFGAGASAREQAHFAALEAWIDGEPTRAAAVWEGILRDHPRDLLAFRLHHFVSFWLGRPDAMLASVLAVEPHWDGATPDYGSILGCRCFAHEESGYYTEAELAGREAIRRDPGDLWAAHGVAHVLEMTGRRGEGIAWVEGLSANWAGANNLMHHLWWHLAMYYVERGDFARALDLYDTRFRDLSSPLTQGAPDLYIDAQNAASMLFRLARHGVDVGARWEELADKAEARIGDCLSGFTLPHWAMALAAAGRAAAGGRMLAAMRDYGQGNSENAALVRDVALPVCAAALAHGAGDHAGALAAMRPVVGEMHRLGGSHAQQDVLEQLFLDAALRSGSESDIRLMLERVAGRHPVPPVRRRGYAMAAGFLG